MQQSLEKVEPLPLMAAPLVMHKQHIIIPIAKKQVIAELPYQQSIHDAYAQEESDDLQDNELAEEIHLPDTAMQPIVHPIAYNITSYLPQLLPISQKMPFINQTHTSGDDTVYTSESADDRPVPLLHEKSINLSEKQFLQVPAHDYTIQLVGSYHIRFIHHYIQVNKLNKIAFQLAVGSAKHPWNMVTYGVFVTEKSAEMALLHLPKALCFNRPWIRQVGNVQQALIQ